MPRYTCARVCSCWLIWYIFILLQVIFMLLIVGVFFFFFLYSCHFRESLNKRWNNKLLCLLLFLVYVFFLNIHKERKYINVSVKFENYSYFEAVVLWYKTFRGQENFFIKNINPGLLSSIHWFHPQNNIWYM